MRPGGTGRVHDAEVAELTITRGIRSYGDLLAQPDAAGLVGWGLLARMPIGMIGLAQVLLVRGSGESYADAGWSRQAEPWRMRWERRWQAAWSIAAGRSAS
jgi:hypothetical protein